MAEQVKIEDYLRGLVAFDVPDSALISIFLKREMKMGEDALSYSFKERELAYADLLMWIATSYSSYSGTKHSDGGWTETEGSKTLSVTDKKEMRALARLIYLRYGDRNYTSKIRKINL